MKKLAVLLLALLLASCAAPAAPPATATPIPPTATQPPPTDTPAPTNTPRPTSTRKPTSTKRPTATKTPQPEPITFTGSGDSIIDIEQPWVKQGAILHAVYTGQHNFIITALDADNEYSAGQVNTIGAYDGKTLFNIESDQSSTRLEVKSSGDWKITFYPFVDTYLHVCRPGVPCDGAGDDVLYFMGSPDTMKIEYTGEHNFIVTGLGGCYEGIVNEIGAYSGTVVYPRRCTLITVQSSGPWIIEAKGK